MAKTFRALRVHRIDKATEARLETLSLDDLNPTVGADGVVIRTAWSGINYKDALAVTGKGKILRRYPLVAGIDGAGVVESSSSPRFKPGDAVLVTGCSLSETLDGGYAEYLHLPAEVVVPLPAGLSLKEAMLLGTAGFTAALAVRRMQENHQTPALGPVAVTGATGGVGSVAIQILSRLGYEVVAITGKPEQSADYLKKLGAAEVVDRRSLELGKAPLESGRWGGAVDNVGGELLDWLTRTVKPWGNIASIGLAGGHTLNTTVMPFILRGVSLLGIHSVECPMPWRLAIWEKLAGDWKPAALDAIENRVIGLEQLPAACAEVIAGRVQGRILVRLNG
ncbi:MAG TPA: YhdH/YhfP family quinone oxidoreductase [Nevskiales bacterium]|nr:YhdH/YhfP family quinone oxidoreductase [Nevskiales bacterium]